ncbi:sugar phosphate isomerase/epimerase family protein [Paenibacillus yanchengensis]|uniref:Sugar phosphate isomerase/epimerase family protein n=1 Tax=Paenibacillus yanchengensis TaxID=2035833 RepID=A0ABW4YFJ5_9BACL
MKFSVFTVMMPDCSVERTIQLLQQYGYDGVEWRYAAIPSQYKDEKPSFWRNNWSTVDKNSTPTELASIKQQCDQANLTVTNLAAYISCGDLAATEQAMQAAQQLGSPSIRVGVPTYIRSKSYQEQWREARGFLEEVVRLAKIYGIKGLVETHHNQIIPSATAARRLLDGLDSQYVGVIYDPGNMVFEGHEQYRMALGILGEYLAHVHIKNAEWLKRPVMWTKQGLPEVVDNKHDPVWEANWCAVAKGVVHWPQVIADLKAIGYNGWLSFEDFSASGSTEQLLQTNLQYIKSLL